LAFELWFLDFHNFGLIFGHLILFRISCLGFRIFKIFIGGFVKNSSVVDAADKKVIAYQLGRTPQGLKSILKRCDKGFPQLVLTLPLLSQNIPFPTIYWLTCPFLNGKVATLESQGFIKQFQKWIEGDKKFKKDLLRAQKAYRDERKKMLSSCSDFPDYAKDALEEVGVGGVSDLSKVKCLHAHYAHYLATGLNPIGGRVAELIGEVACDKECEKK
jgi:hypothetical protein